MEFSSLLFLYLLLPVFVLIYFMIPGIRGKNTALLAISLLLYALGQPLHMLFMVGLSYVNYRLAHRIDYRDRGTLVFPVAVNIVLLMLLRALAHFLNMPAILPVGIAFYILSVISYVVDVYKRRIKAEKSFLDLLLYLMLFPKMAQGPIVRYEQMKEQLEDRKHHPRMIFEGLQRFVTGLAKKVLLADACGRVVLELNSNGADTTLVGVWFAAILVLFRVYYDFSGYSDMAIGLGKVFGFRICENFDRPYTELTVMGFAKSWNLSLGHFFRDYVYIPLGSNRMGNARWLVNIFVVSLLYGFWHGAGWNYLLFGLYFFLLLMAEKQLMPMLETLPDGLRRCILYLMLLIGWVIFSHENLSDLHAAFMGMLGYGGFATAGLGSRIWNCVPLLAACVIGCTDLPGDVRRIFAGVCGMGRKRRRGNVITPLRVAYLLVCLGFMVWLLWLCTASLVGEASLPSVYGNL